MGARVWLVWTLLGLLVGAAAPLSPAALAADELSRTETVLTNEIDARRELVTAAFQWLDATLARDFDAQSAFYPERMDAFYLWRDVPKSAVMAEKRRVFDEARTIDIRIDPPQLIVDPGARSGRMYFRKTYVIRGKGKLNRNGEVLQELRWAKQDDGWKIVSERDLRVIRSKKHQAPSAQTRASGTSTASAPRLSTWHGRPLKESLRKDSFGYRVRSAYSRLSR